MESLVTQLGAVSKFIENPPDVQDEDDEDEEEEDNYQKVYYCEAMRYLNKQVVTLPQDFCYTCGEYLLLSAVILKPQAGIY